jgi:hypothetical protein
MSNTDYNKTLEGIKTLVKIYEDVKAAKADDGKITWTEDLSIVVQNAVPAVRMIADLKEIGAEILDTDEAEAEAATELVAAEFGGSPEAKEYIKEIAGGLAQVYEAVKGLVELKKA